jgi:hypothetical protein
VLRCDRDLRAGRALRDRRSLQPAARALALLVAGALAATFAAAADATATGAIGSAGSTGASGSTGSTGSTGPAGAPNVTNPSISLNWAGYAISGDASVVRHFKHVSGSWVAPAVTCTPGSTTYSAFWVGLGGLSERSTGLEQTGIEADCDANGVAHYNAWYELVPAGPVTLKLAIAAGDSVSAAVSVQGTHVTLRLLDDTTGASVVKHLRLARPDTSSAEWIAEAPSTCNTNRSCTALALTDFGTVDFTNASARTARGVAGTISGPTWFAHAIALDESSRRPIGARVFGPATLVTAEPTILEDSGSSFAVNWAEVAPAYGPGGGPSGRNFPGFSA